MARFFKERLAEEQFDWSVHPHGDFAEHVGSLGSLLTQCPARPDNLIPAPWVYCVETCGFTFRFRTLTELIHYRDYFSTEHLPSQRLPSSRRAKNTGTPRV